MNVILCAFHGGTCAMILFSLFYSCVRQLKTTCNCHIMLFGNEIPGNWETGGYLGSLISKSSLEVQTGSWTSIRRLQAGQIAEFQRSKQRKGMFGTSSLSNAYGVCFRSDTLYLFDFNISQISHAVNYKYLSQINTKSQTNCIHIAKMLSCFDCKIGRRRRSLTGERTAFIDSSMPEMCRSCVTFRGLSVFCQLFRLLLQHYTL